MSFSVKVYDDNMPTGYAQAVTLLQASSALREILYNIPDEIRCVVPSFLGSLKGLENDFHNEANRIIAEEDKRFDEVKREWEARNEEVYVA